MRYLKQVGTFVSLGALLVGLAACSGEKKTQETTTTTTAPADGTAAPGSTTTPAPADGSMAPGTSSTTTTKSTEKK